MMQTTLQPKNQIKTIYSIAFPIVGILLLIYITLQFIPLITGPLISIEEPKPGSTLQSGITTVRATGKRATAAYVNGYPVAVDTTGSFAQDIVITPKLNTITVKTQNRYGTTDTETIMVWGAEKEILPLPTPEVTKTPEQ